MVLASETNPDVAILDDLLPKLNGLDLARQIRRNCPRTEVLIYTNYIREEIVLERLRAGVRGIVLKSDPPEHLIAAVDSLSVHRPYFSDAISEDSLARFRDSKLASSACSLTPSERRIVQMVAEGGTSKRIAYELDISVKTVDSHRATAMHKLNLHSIAGLVRYAIRNNIAQV
jgi:DNA-binding NarL/FixJ family response regulator